MVDLKELLGEAYTPELEEAISTAYVPNDGTYIPKTNLDGEVARLKKERDEAKQKISEYETASLSAEEKAKKEFEDAIAEANATRQASLKMMSKLELQTGLATSGIDLEKHADTLELLVGDDPERAKNLSTGLQKLIAEATILGETKANEAHLKNNGVPGGDRGDTITRESFKAMTLDDRMKLSLEQPEVYKSLMKEG